VRVRQDGERIIVVLPADGPPPVTADRLGAPGTVPPREGLPPSGPDRLVLPPGSGAARWWALVREAVAGCRRPLSLLMVACDALPAFFLLRIAVAMTLAPLLSETTGGLGPVLLPVVALIAVCVSSLLSAVFLAATVGLVTGWAADGRPPRVGALLALVGPRIWVVWIWLAVFHGVEFAMSYAAPTSFVGWVAGPVGWACSMFVGVLGPVVLFERGRGPRRAAYLLRSGARVPVLGLVVTSGVMTLLPLWAGDLVEHAGGDIAGIVADMVLAMVCSVFWAVSATVTYAALVAAESADRGDHRPLTAGLLRDSLAAEGA
jgi:hypothetical protein